MDFFSKFSRKKKFKIKEAEELKLIEIQKENARINEIVEQLLAKIQVAINTEFDPQFSTFTKFEEELAVIKQEFEILYEIAYIFPDIRSIRVFAFVFSALRAATYKYESWLPRISTLSKAEDNLSDEIAEFIKTVHEMANKFKLSSDWEGKKPQMIAAGKKLSSRRLKLLEEEAKLDEKLKEMYREFAKLHKLFIENSHIITEYIKEKRR